MVGCWRSLRSLLLVATVGSLAACGSAAGTASKAQDQVFLSQVHNAAPDVGTYRNDTQLVRLGHVACDAFRSGVSYQQLATRLPVTEGRNPLPPSDLGAVITAAVAAYCPQYHDKVS